MSNQTLDELLGIETVLEGELVSSEETALTTAPTTDIVVSDKLAPVREEELEDDFQFARKNIREMVKDMKNVMASAALLAQSGDAPKAYEVVGKLLENITNANKDLVELHKTKKDTLETPEKRTSLLPQDGGGNVTVNADKAVFVGRASDLIREVRQLVAQQKKDEDASE